MRIAISGTANTGKTTLLKAFLNKWNMYTTPIKTYRDVIKENGLNHSSKTSDETQLHILNWMMEEQAKYPKGSKIIYDRCPWDNLAYTLHANSKGLVTDEIAAATISFVKESMKDLDIIFWLKRNPHIKIIKDDLRDTDEQYIAEVDSVFDGLFKQYMENLESDAFYPKEDCPAIVCIDESFPSVDDKLMFIGEFIDYRGDLIEGDSVLDPSNMEMFEKMLKEHEHELENEERIDKIVKEFKNPYDDSKKKSKKGRK